MWGTAAKIHVVSAPAYYHNYMMGQLFACQVHATIAREVLKAKDIPNAVYTDNKKVGEFMKARVFAPGATLPWNDLTKHATGAELNAKAFSKLYHQTNFEALKVQSDEMKKPYMDVLVPMLGVVFVVVGALILLGKITV